MILSALWIQECMIKMKRKQIPVTSHFYIWLSLSLSSGPICWLQETSFCSQIFQFFADGILNFPLFRHFRYLNHNLVKLVSVLLSNSYLCSAIRVEVFVWIFVRNAVNAVNFCEKCGDCGECGEKNFSAFHRISYKNSPHLLSNVYWIWFKFTRNIIEGIDTQVEVPDGK